jgi:hypothetical protein
VLTECWWENLRTKYCLNDLGVNEKVILKWIFKKWDGDMDCIDLTQERHRFLVLVNAVMKVRVR